MNYIWSLFRGRIRAMEEYEDDFDDFGIDKDDSDYLNNSYTGFCKGLFPQRLLFNQVWSRLEEIVDAILKQEQIDKSKWDAAFLDVYQLCTAVPKPLANELYKEVDAKIVNHVSAVHEQLTKYSGRQFLEYLMNQNASILRISAALNNAFRHLNNYISLQSKDMIMNQIIGRSDVNQETTPRYHIGTLAMCRWKEKVLVPAAGTICSLLLEQFEIHRQGKQADMIHLLKAAVHGYVIVDDPIKEQESALVAYKKRPENDMELYKNAFENPLKESCEKYYQTKAVEWSKITDSLELIENVANLIEREKQLMNDVMHESTIMEAEHWAANILIGDKLQNVPLDFKLRMRDDVFDSKNIQKCYQVLKLIDHGLKELIDQFEEYIIDNTRKRLGEQANDPKVFVNVVAETSHFFHGIVNTVFENCPHFAEAMNKALRKIVNEPGSNIKAGDRLARYADAMLKKSKDKDAEGRSQENLILVLDYLKDKEQFEKPYQSLLAIRLLGRISAGATAEEMMILNLKSSCSVDSLQRFNRMCYDIKKSSGEKNAFYATPEGKKCTSKFPIDFLVLQTGAWPLQPFKEGTTRFYPNEVIQAMTAFEAHYTSIHNGRTLLWAPFVSTVDVELTYLDKSYVLTMTAIHYDVLNCFQEIDECAVNDVCSKLQMSLEGLKRYLKGFIDNQIIVTDSKLEDISDNTKIKLNLSFNRRNNRIRIGIPLTNRTLKQEIRPEVADVQNNQKHFIDCVLVRIMKAKKVVKHAELVAEVISTVKDRFSPSTVIIKTCIESLIERAYMKRTAEIDEYEYIQ